MSAPCLVAEWSLMVKMFVRRTRKEERERLGQNPIDMTCREAVAVAVPLHCRVSDQQEQLCVVFCRLLAATFEGHITSKLALNAKPSTISISSTNLL